MGQPRMRVEPAAGAGGWPRGAKRYLLPLFSGQLTFVPDGDRTYMHVQTGKPGSLVLDATNCDARELRRFATALLKAVTPKPKRARRKP